jgi:DNA-binding NtrC family response regulator
MTHHIRIPPLRNRLEDLPLLVNHFSDAAAISLGKAKPSVPRELIAILATYQFPGNVRELESMVFDAVSRSNQETLSIHYFKEYIQKHTQSDQATGASPQNDNRTIFYTGEFPTLREVEDFFVNEALEKCKGNQLMASKLLGLSQSTLSRRLKGKKDD